MFRKVKIIGKFLGFFLNESVIGITLAPFGIYVRESEYFSKTVVKHEYIHWKQQMEMGIIFFYLWYLIEWGIKFIAHGSSAYYYISFEREAYTFESDETYLDKRKHYAWFKYLRVKE